jgi:hypothetical protein
VVDVLSIYTGMTDSLGHWRIRAKEFVLQRLQLHHEA